jgi:hypothetical protein
MEDNNISEESKQEVSYQKNKKLFKKALVSSFFIILLVLSFWLGFWRGEKSKNNSDAVLPLNQAVIINQDQGKNNTLDFSLFWKTFDLLKEKYVDSSQLDSKNSFMVR